MRYALILSLTAASFAQPSPVALQSPDGRLAISFRTNDTASGQLVYFVTFQGKPLIEPSALKLDLQGQRPLGADVRIVNSAASSTDETYHLVTGKASSVRNHYNAIRLDLEETGGPARKLVIEARAYDDAVAFRYVVPQQPALREFRLTKENTEFRLSKDATTYSLLLPNYRSMYESEFVKLPASAFVNQGGVASTALIGLPMLLEVPGVAWMAITEAGLRDYASMYLVNLPGGWTTHAFESRLSPDPNESEIAVSWTLPHHS